MICSKREEDTKQEMPTTARPCLKPIENDDGEVGRLPDRPQVNMASITELQPYAVTCVLSLGHGYPQLEHGTNYGV